MAWKRGTENNSAGPIRKGHIEAFQIPKGRELGAGSAPFRIIDVPRPRISSALALVGAQSFPEQLSCYVDTSTRLLHIHAHEYARSVLLAQLSDEIPPGCISLSPSQRINAKVCVNDTQDFTAFRGSVFAYDAREGGLGTAIHWETRPVATLQEVKIDVRPLHSGSEPIQVSAQALARQLAAALHSVIVTVDDIYVVAIEETELVCRVVGVGVEIEGEAEAEDEAADDEDPYRGMVSTETSFLTSVDLGAACSLFTISGVQSFLVKSTPRRDIVDVVTSDGEVFPVRRSLLRPCIALTAVVQAGLGKYKSEQDSSVFGSGSGSGSGSGGDRQVVPVPVDCCTFDRVLLYLLHLRRESKLPWAFDPLLANDLLSAAESLGLQGLIDLTKKVLGSFEERVRRKYISFEEVRAMNDAGTACSREGRERSATWLIMRGAVFDITRWLPEHPGGSTIIPEHALNRDCTGQFEIYHASRQSFLYLREFYVGELDPYDFSALVSEQPSQTFIAHLSKVMEPWRLKPENLSSSPEGKALLKSF